MATLKYKNKDTNPSFTQTTRSRRASNSDRYNRKDYSAYWFALILVIVALYIILNTLGYLK